MACPPVDSAWLKQPTSAAHNYLPPEPLLALHILDLLELCGSQNRAARALDLHQSTVSRCAAQIREQFRLRPQLTGGLIRYGSNDCLRLLRQAARAHRRMEGLLRIGVDPLHQPLLAGLPGVLATPPLFRLSDHWAWLIDQALLDGAIVSSWCHPQPLPWEAIPHWPGVKAVPLGRLPLQLVSAWGSAAVARRGGAARTAPRRPGSHAWETTAAGATTAVAAAAGEGSPLRRSPPAGAEPQPAAIEPGRTAPNRVLLPRRGVAPRLHELFLQQGFRVEVQPQSCQEPAAWLKRLRDRRLVMPLCPALLDRQWFRSQGLVIHPEPWRLQESLSEQLWLLLPHDLDRASEAAGAAQVPSLLQGLRQRLTQALQAG
ncbi:MAG: hypothetical protein VKJ44_04935 [Synechococcus sp.]|nr:hypothetical protein [Synechococcus sp.]